MSAAQQNDAIHIVFGPHFEFELCSSVVVVVVVVVVV